MTSAPTSTILGEALPRLAALPRAGLLGAPTPVQPLAGLAQVYVKRDDLTAADYGGNKIRKLDFLLGEARRDGCGAVLAFGYAGSNFVAATAWHARKLGLSTLAGLLPQCPAAYVVGNLSVSLHCGAELFVGGSPATLAATAVARSLRRLAREGRAPRWMAPGGSNALGALGFVEAAFELRRQIDAGELPAPRSLYVPFSSMGTVAGLVTGLALAGLPTQVIAVQVVGETLAGRARLGRLLADLAVLLRRHGVAVPEAETLLARVVIRTEFYGGEYACRTDAAAAAVARFTAAAGARADSAYTGKALACLYADAATRNLAAPALYWHTFSATALPPGVPLAPASAAPHALRHHWTLERAGLHGLPLLCSH
ncbi:1-aminocyclopropane-1-carboxylate deaminase/D-cysteine desulfhydrase [Solimonas flava]|uniref:1-aminocyclopropane-1-carboxylate deaminase/D-cysteine desulfhydrase n=1 Tax=Solimonas flava TaxID=415849 RepID=UPI0003F6C1D3|nr:pyridoxal-phosphate dependent enzyme [Solimonas flava]